LAGLPLPPVIKAPQVLEGLVPQPHLHISLVPAQERSWHGLLCATLRFEYGDLLVFRFDDQTPLLLDLPSLSVAPSTGMTTPIERIILHRDMAFERATRANLRTLGLQTDHLGQCHLNPAYTPAGQWLSWADNDYQAFKDAGFAVTTDANLDGLISRADDLVVQLAEQHDQDKNAWFDLSLGTDINGQRHNILPMLPELLAQLSPPPRSATSLGADEPDLTIPPYIYLAQADGNYLRLPTEPLKPWLQALLDLFGERGVDFKKGDTLRLTRLEALRVGASLGEGVQWQGANQLRRRITPFMLRRHKAEVATDLPEKLTQISSVELTDKQANLYETIRLTTEQSVREALIERFTSGEVPLFLISLKAGGVGLNLTQADTVIHYDP